jgi:uncharacterized membrane protein YccC
MGAAVNPAAAYPLMLARFTEIALGIACTALVSRLILPRELTPKRAAMVRALTRRVHGLAESAADPARVRSQRPLVMPSFLISASFERSAVR